MTIRLILSIALFGSSASADFISFVQIDGTVKENFLVSPFPSVHPVLTMRNASEVMKGKISRGMIPYLPEHLEQLEDAKITDIIIFRNDVEGESGVADEIKLLSARLNPATGKYEYTIDPLTKQPIPRFKVHPIPFQWKGITKFKQSCQQTIQALRLMKTTLETQDMGLYFHCTVGEDRTGYLAGLYRIIFDSWSQDDALQNEMCQYGYAESDGQKPNTDDHVAGNVVALVQQNITPVYAGMLDLIAKGLVSKNKLDESVCNDKALEQAFRDRQKNWKTLSAQFKCDTIHMNEKK